VREKLQPPSSILTLSTNQTNMDQKIKVVITEDHTVLQEGIGAHKEKLLI
jgi:hypothetical protein